MSFFLQIHFTLSFIERFKMGVVALRFKYSLSWPRHLSYKIPSPKVFFQIRFWVFAAVQGERGWLPVYAPWRLKLCALVSTICRRVLFFRRALCAWTLTPRGHSRNKQMSKRSQPDWQLLRARSQITRQYANQPISTFLRNAAPPSGYLWFAGWEKLHTFQ